MTQCITKEQLKEDLLALDGVYSDFLSDVICGFASEIASFAEKNPNPVNAEDDSEESDKYMEKRITIEYKWEKIIQKCVYKYLTR